MITTVTTSIVSITNAWFGRTAYGDTRDRLDKIHEQTNGGWTKVHKELGDAMGEIMELKRLLQVEKDKGT